MSKSSDHRDLMKKFVFAGVGKRHLEGNENDSLALIFPGHLRSFDIC